MKKKTLYRCSNCGFESIKWLGKCPTCSSWNTLEEITVELKNTDSRTRQTSKKSIKKLYEVVSSKSNRIVTGINEFDRVMGGGIVKDSISIITARPGAGKSTLLLQISNCIAKEGYKVIYASGEESDSQIKNRADRILDKIHENIWVLQENNLDNVLDAVEEIDPDMVIIDSIQTFTMEASLPARAGSPTQTMECANALLHVAKNEKRPRAVIIVGQMTKNDELAGLRALEHLVDTVLIIEDDNDEELRVLVSSKNRFGGIENGFFQMREEGIVSIDNPSEFFMTKREEGEVISGSALTVIKEGTRCIITEIESLVSKSFTPYPTRIGETLGKDKLNTLISILEQRGNINLYDKNVIIKTTGGIKIREQGINLAVIMSIVSSVKQQGIESNIAFIADVGLTGELKKVPSLESRIKEIERMGFKKVYVAYDSFTKTNNFKKIQIFELKTLIDVIKHVYNC
ncbi:DNA repair protein RadA/Sms [Clostridium saccharoperbutylacetonicum]|uniref:DNA repair protein RadA n=1 Tax=Clostridium saccharoperbutylacetonicum N1-4(HMT) TaxID=931276 RepID=M1MG81_9CLOT|nr:DNA repair protein RadA [Clostridium saccharoperbutylacetonicum]AGF53981.1 DNA repair protein RadA [Clostridium saccharoperbutylacetonicum N1-4(HMT)]NRT59506.1 DNA repair protein RadA/Sms [Clostridium saccharoperbutylacetonicum]NSB28698.1 DNA repair protein RadA/Sms [Clostridium saccharoperbutylacetonicum]NSB42189.1 DNA repair protein RadA/Sms [Clostridium saccharoperbutylacetonicum]